MNPLNFRNQSLGLVRSIYVVGYNEWRAFLNSKSLLLSMTLQPFLYYGLWVLALNTNFSSVVYNGQIMPYKRYAFIGVLAILLTGQMSQAMYRSTIDKQYGLMAMKFLNGVQPSHYLAGLSMFPITGFMYQSLILFGLGCLTNVGIGGLNFLLGMLVALVALLFWSVLGVLISSRIKTYQTRDVIMTLFFVPLTFASPTFYLLNKSPLFIKLLASINPLTYQLNAIRSVAYGGNPDWIQIFVAISMTIILLFVVQFLLRHMKLTLQER